MAPSAYGFYFTHPTLKLASRVPPENKTYDNMQKRRRLFCEISPLCYQLSVWKGCFLRWVKDAFSRERFAKHRCTQSLPVCVRKHKSLIRRTLGDVDQRLQNNKAVNLSLAAPKITGILIRPGETFSLWHLVGRTSAKKGYLPGLMIARGKPTEGIGGGLCQLSNLIHWLILHSPLTIVEHHHHDQWDLFPDCGRVVPFGLGTSISYNYLDYRVKNETANTFQLILSCGETHLTGELRAQFALPVKFHITLLEEHFVQEGDDWYRTNKIARTIIEKSSGKVLSSTLIKESHAKVCYAKPTRH